MIPRVKALGLIEAYPDGKPANLSNIDKRFLNGAWDPGNKFSVPYLWGTTGIAYNKQKIKKPPASWNDLWNPEYSGKIGMLDNSRDSIGIALLAQGLPSESTTEGDLKKAEEHLLKQKPLLKHYTNASYIDELVSGELWITSAWSGDVLQAARENKEVEYVIPKEGSFMWVDALCLIAKSEHREDALKYVDYILRPEVEEEIVETVRYPTPNAKAKPLLPEAIKKDPRIFPPADVMKRLKFHDVITDEQTQAINALWQKVKLS
jgi:spermidine/putrescine-binding protein